MLDVVFQHNGIVEEQEPRITSVQLTDIINEYRKEEKGENYTPIVHYDLFKKIRKEQETLELLGLGDNGNFSVMSYKDNSNRNRECYSLNRDGALMILNSESTFVRYKTVEYINKLEEQIAKPSYMIEDKVQRARRWADEQEEVKLALEEREKLIEEQLPKAQFHDQFVISNTSLLTRATANLYKEKGLTEIVVDGELRKMSMTNLFAWFKEHSYMCKSNTKSTKNRPTIYSVNNGLMEEKVTNRLTKDGTVVTDYTTYITSKGIKYFMDKIAKEVKLEKMF